LYEQYRGFFDLESILIAEVSPRRPIAADVLLGTERTAQAQVIKQPDVLMLHHLLPEEVAADSLRPNLDFYDPRTAHGSSLSPAIHAALLARDGRSEAALQWLNIAARIDLDDLTGSTAGGLHLATMGGLWQALVFGFAGVRACRDHLRIDPRLPRQWRSLSVGLRYQGEPLRLHVGSESVEIETEALRLERVDEHWEVTPR
jgi:trehalose/maltose hydrolase-like predicted phosphorylase